MVMPGAWRPTSGGYVPDSRTPPSKSQKNVTYKITTQWVFYNAIILHVSRRVLANLSSIQFPLPDECINKKKILLFPSVLCCAIFFFIFCWSNGNFCENTLFRVLEKDRQEFPLMRSIPGGSRRKFRSAGNDRRTFGGVAPDKMAAEQLPPISWICIANCFIIRG